MARSRGLEPLTKPPEGYVNHRIHTESKARFSLEMQSEKPQICHSSISAKIIKKILPAGQNPYNTGSQACSYGERDITRPSGGLVRGSSPLKSAIYFPSLALDPQIFFGDSFVPT